MTTILTKFFPTDTETDPDLTEFNKDPTNPETETYNIFNYVPQFVQNIFGYKQSAVTNSLFGSYIDPVVILLASIFALFMYFYFANEIMCQILGLFYPCYCLYGLLHYNITDRADKIKSMMRYFIVYGHLEVLLTIGKIFSMYFYHLKIIILLGLLYMAHYRVKLFEKIYLRMIFYDKVLTALLTSLWSKIYAEIVKNINNLSQNKKKKLI